MSIRGADDRQGGVDERASSAGEDLVLSTPQPTEADGVKKPKAGLVKMVAVSTAAIVVAGGIGVGAGSLIGLGEAGVLPTRLVPTPESSPSETLSQAPLGEGVGAEAVETTEVVEDQDSGVAIDPGKAGPGSGEAASVDGEKGRASGAEGAGDSGEPGGGVGNEPGAGNGGVVAPPVTTPSNPSGKPETFTRGNVFMDQTNMPGRGRVWRITITGLDQYYLVTINATNGYGNRDSSPTDWKVVYDTPVRVGEGDVTWTISVHNRMTGGIKTSIITTW